MTRSFEVPCSSLSACGSDLLATTLYGIKNCDTMKKARTWLDSHAVQYEFHDYKTAGIDPEVLTRWCAEVGWEMLLNGAARLSASCPTLRRPA